MVSTSTTVGRRHLLIGAGGVVGASLVVACADGGRDRNGGQSSTPSTSGTPTGFGLVQRFPNLDLIVPGEVRLPISLTDGQNLLTEGPDRLTGWIETFDGTRVATVDARRRDEGIEIPYWDVRAVLEQAVIHTLRIEGDDGYGASFEVWEPAQVSTPLTGAPLPPFDTPTVDDHRGVEPYCSLAPTPCPLHEVTLTEALASGRPVVYLVGTPAHCTTGTCGPGLELLVAEHERLGDRVVMVHADVYADAAATAIAPAVEALDLAYEPVIYLCDASGVIIDRLDAVWDGSELRERLDLLVG